MQISAHDRRLSWPGAVSLEQDDAGVMPWRLPYVTRELFPAPLVERAAMPAGVRLAFTSDATSIAGRRVPAAESAPLDLVCDGRLVATVEQAGEEGFRFDELPAGEKRIELWLPQFGPFRLRSLELNDGAGLAPPAGPAPGTRWVTYGSSITQCRTAKSPTATWPAIVARERGLDLTCLGYGGQCHLDVVVARMMRDLPADFLSMCVGINIYGGATLNPRSFRAAIIGFVQIVREGHPQIPFVVLSPIWSPPRETQANAVGFTLQAMREEVADAVEVLRAHGDSALHYVDGFQVFGPELEHLLPDQLHPDAEGYRVLGQNFLRAVAAPYFR